MPSARSIKRFLVLFALVSLSAFFIATAAIIPPKTPRGTPQKGAAERCKTAETKRRVVCLKQDTGKKELHKDVLTDTKDGTPAPHPETYDCKDKKLTSDDRLSTIQTVSLSTGGAVHTTIACDEDGDIRKEYGPACARPVSGSAKGCNCGILQFQGPPLPQAVKDKLKSRCFSEKSTTKEVRATRYIAAGTAAKAGMPSLVTTTICACDEKLIKVQSKQTDEKLLKELDALERDHGDGGVTTTFLKKELEKLKKDIEAETDEGKIKETISDIGKIGEAEGYGRKKLREKMFEVYERGLLKKSEFEDGLSRFERETKGMNMQDMQKYIEKMPEYEPRNDKGEVDEMKATYWQRYICAFTGLWFPRCSGS